MQRTAVTTNKLQKTSILSIRASILISIYAVYKMHMDLTSVLSHFWRRWRSEYLSELRECHRYAAKNTHVPCVLAEEDIVIIHDDALPRGHWKLGRIQEVYSGKDGLPRSALVRVATRNRQDTLLKRPIQLLYPLEIPHSRSILEPTPEPEGTELLQRLFQHQKPPSNTLHEPLLKELGGPGNRPFKSIKY